MNLVGNSWDLILEEEYKKDYFKKLVEFINNEKTIWTIVTFIFSYYLEHFANYNVLYGNLSSLIILMMWLYIISYVFVMGIAINVANFENN